MTKIEIKVTSSGPFSLTVAVSTDETTGPKPKERRHLNPEVGDLRASDDHRFYDEEAEAYEDDTEDDFLDQEDEETMISFQQCVAALKSRSS